jgi:hypothetical protein
LMHSFAAASKAALGLMGTSLLLTPCPIQVSYFCSGSDTQDVIHNVLGLQPSPYTWPAGNVGTVLKVDPQDGIIHVSSDSSTWVNRRAKKVANTFGTDERLDFTEENEILAVTDVDSEIGDGDIDEIYDDVSGIPEFCQGSVYSASLLECLLAGSYFEPHLTTMLRALAVSRNSHLQLMAIPPHLLVKRVGWATSRTGANVKQTGSHSTEAERAAALPTLVSSHVVYD